MPPAEALFAYGTLCCTAVLERVCGERFAGEPAVLPGHRCRLLRGEIFPAVIPDPAAETTGILYRDVDHRILSLLDAYEGEWYQRRRRTVITAVGAEVPAWVYLLAPAFTHLLSDRPWDLDHFRRHHLAHFLATFS